MTEQGNDTMLPLDYDGQAQIDADETALDAEQARVEAETPASDEGGEQYPDPDEYPADEES